MRREPELPGEAFALALDPGGLLRRECEECHRVFKVRVGELDAHSTFRALARHLVHANDAELADIPPERFCPYCPATAPDDAWFTAEQRAAVEQRADHWRRELRYQQLSQPRRTLGDNPFVTYLAVPPEPMPKRAAPVPDGLRPFPLLCCREVLFISSAWHGPVRCHFCGVVNEIDRVMPGFLERLGDSGVDL